MCPVPDFFSAMTFSWKNPWCYSTTVKRQKTGEEEGTEQTKLELYHAWTWTKQPQTIIHAFCCYVFQSFQPSQSDIHFISSQVLRSVFAPLSPSAWSFFVFVISRWSSALHVLRVPFGINRNLFTFWPFFFSAAAFVALSLCLQKPW